MRVEADTRAIRPDRREPVNERIGSNDRVLRMDPLMRTAEKDVWFSVPPHWA